MSLNPALEQPGFQDDAAIRQYVDVLWRRKAVSLMVFLGVMVLGLALTATLKPVYQASTKIQVPVPDNRRPQQILDPNDAASELEQVGAGRVGSIGAQVDEISSKAFILEAMRQAHIPNIPGKNPNVKVESPDFQPSDVIRVTVEGDSPKQVASLANKLAFMHVYRTERDRSADLDHALNYVRHEREHAARLLEQANRELRSFRAQYPVEDWTAEQALHTKQRQDLQTRLIDARSSVASLEKQYDELKAQLRAEAPSIPVRQTKDNPQRQQLQDKIRLLRVERLDTLKDFQPNSPEVQAIDDQISSYERELKAEPPTLVDTNYTPNARRVALDAKVTDTQAALITARNTFQALTREFKEKDRPMEDLGPLRMKLETLTKAQQEAEQRYNLMTQRLQSLELRRNARSEIAQVIDRAEVPKEPAKPMKLLLFAITLMTAFFLSVGTAFLLELLDDRTNSADQVERLTALPTLGRVPRLPAGSGEPARLLAPNSPIADAYRALRSAVGFASFDTELRRLQVTSPAAGEGKTTTSVHLAVAMAMDGKRVLLVDADMRRPRVHEAMDLDQSPGLSEVLAGRTGVDAAIQETDVKNLRVLAAGTIPPNPAEMLGSTAFEAVIEQLEDQADIVIFDTPACLPVTDPILIAPRMDGVLLVVQSGTSRKGDIAQGMELLDRARARLLGTVFNRVERSGKAYYRYAARGYSARGRAARPGRPEMRRNGHSPRLPEMDVTRAVVPVMEGQEEDA